MDNTKVVVVLVGEKTKYLYKYIRWEIGPAIKKEISIIVVNLNKKRRRLINDLERFRVWMITMISSKIKGESYEEI